MHDTVVQLFRIVDSFS